MAVDNVYKKVYNIVTEKVTILEENLNALKNENMRLKNELAIANAKIDVYERITSVSDSKTALGFGPPIRREEGNE